MTKYKPIKLWGVTFLFALAIGAGGFLAIGSKMLTFIIFAILLLAIGLALLKKSECWKWIVVCVCILFLLSLFVPLDVAFARGQRFGVAIRQDPFLTEFDPHFDGSIKHRHQSNLGIGIKTRWYVILVFPKRS
jgi:hypothetical protein